MKKLTTLLLSGICGLLSLGAQAQMPDRDQYQQELNSCEGERQKLLGKLNALRAEKETALQELRQGYFCSKCKNSKSSIEKGGENFEAHLGRVKGQRVAATAAEIAQNQNGFQTKIHDLENDVDSKRLDCERVSMSYQKAYQSAQTRAQQDAQRIAQHDADARAQHEADAKQQQLAAQQAQQEQERQAREAERQRREEAERMRQAQLALNILRFQDRINSNNTETQAKLAEQRQNSNLDGISTYSSASERTARNTVDETSSNGLRRQAFGGNQFLRGGLYDNTKALTQEIIREKLNSMADNAKERFKEHVNNYLFGEDPNAQQNDNEDNNGSPWTEFKSRVQTALVHKIGNRILEADSRNGGVLNKIYAPYERYKQEKSYFESRTLTKFNEENTEYISKLLMLLLVWKTRRSFSK